MIRVIAIGLFFGLVACDKPAPGTTRQKEIHSRCLNTESVIGVGPSFNGKGAGVATTVSSVCTKNQKIFITEKYLYNEWTIIKVELVE